MESVLLLPRKKSEMSSAMECLGVGDRVYDYDSI